MANSLKHFMQGVTPSFFDKGNGTHLFHEVNNSDHPHSFLANATQGVSASLIANATAIAKAAVANATVLAALQGGNTSTAVGNGSSPIIVILNQNDSPVDGGASPGVPTVDDSEAPILDLFNSEEQEQLMATGLMVLLILLILSLFGAHLFRKLKLRMITLPAWATFLGLVTGGVIKLIESEHTILERILAFKQEVFFIMLLPPIIFERSRSTLAEDDLPHAC
eukprot:GHVN01089235.1.p1 GENE.GHVN01089235.1~~GHVN01089235.1.p1  ORF type:complete len:245 (-),score=25.72 GHVN01089235.1:38-706(-)